MLENIAIIASIISGLTAITTSLRAVGASREFSRHNKDLMIKTGCRVGDYKAAVPASRRNSLGLHQFVTIIWYVLSVVCALPLLIDKWSAESNGALVVPLFPFLLLAIILCLIWRKILHHKT
jgi:hypothetical protein